MSCNILRTDVLAVAPQLSTLPDAAWVMILALVNDFDWDCDPVLKKLALCFFGAHLGTVSGSTGASGATGPVISESAGGLKRTYAQATSTASVADLNRTTYGQQFLALLKFGACTRGPVLV